MIFEVSPHYKSVENNGSCDIAKLEPRGMVGIYVGDH